MYYVQFTLIKFLINIHNYLLVASVFVTKKMKIEALKKKIDLMSKEKKSEHLPNIIFKSDSKQFGVKE